MYRTVSGFVAIALASWAARTPTGTPSSSPRTPPAGSTVRLAAGTTALGGRPLALAPRDSAVAILVTSAECSRGRMGIAAFRQLEQRLRDAGIAFRVVVKSRPAPSRQYARLFLHPESVVGDPEGELLGPLDTGVVPTLVVLNRAGVVVVRRAPLSTRPEDAPAIVREASAVTGDRFTDPPRSAATHLDRKGTR